MVLATHTAGVSVDGYTLTLAANPWNIVRTYNLTPGRELLFACRYRLGTASNFVVYMSEADNVYDPLYGSFVGDQGAWRVYPRAGAAVGGHAGPVQHADQGQRLRGRVRLSNGPAGGLAGPHGLGLAGRAHRGAMLCSPRAWTPRAQSPAQRSQPQAPSPEPRRRPQGPCQAAR